MEEQIYYRPVWTCGRFNAKESVAIYYNLIDGMAYFFEGMSASIIGLILALPRNGSISVSKLSDISNISENSIVPFMESLAEIGLLTSQFCTEEIVNEYRTKTKHSHTNSNSSTYAATKEDSAIELNDAELAYKERVGGIVGVMLELTYNCSEKCIHCYNIGATRNDEETSHRDIKDKLSLNDYIRIIDELYDEGVAKVCLSGGDPFSNKYVWNILDYLYSKDIAVDIFTNGQSIVGKEKLIADYFPRIVGLSLYSGVAIEHDNITRVKGSWNKTISVIDSLSALSVPMVLKCCVMLPNVKSYNTVTNVAKQYGLYVQYELNVTDSIDGDKCVSHYLRLNPELLEIVLRDSNTAMYVGNEVTLWGGMDINMDENTCRAGYNTFCITPNGDLIPCCAFHLHFGNLKLHHLRNILTDNPILEKWQHLKMSDYEECGTHEYCSFCSLCAGINYSEHGTPTKAAENNCYLAKIRHKLAQKMKYEQYDPLGGKSLQERLKELPTISVGRLQREYSQKEETY